MTRFFKLAVFTIISIGLLSCSGGKKVTPENETEAAIDYSKPAFFRGKVKEMKITGYPQLGDMTMLANADRKITEIVFGEGKKVTMDYDESGNLIKYRSSAEARDLPMFGAEFVQPWFRNLLSSYYISDITFTYENGKLTKFMDNNKGWTETFSYDDKGNISTVKISDKKNTGFNNPTYVYEDKDGKKHRTIKSGYESVTYTYDSDNKLIASDESLTDITYNEKNDIIECKTIMWDDNLGGPAPNMLMKYTYTYDDKGNWTKREGKSQKWNNNAKAATGSIQDMPIITRTITYYE